jgi:hypothetical protein
MELPRPTSGRVNVRQIIAVYEAFDVVKGYCPFEEFRQVLDIDPCIWHGIRLCITFVK